MPESGMEPATISFAQVDTAGDTTIDVLDSPPPLPDGYLQLGSLFYNVDTSATFSGNVTVCLSYDPASITQPLQLLHYDGEAWIDVTTSNDEVNGQICGDVSSLSPFALAPLEPPADTTPPETTITAVPTEFTSSTSATFGFSSNESGSVFICSLDGQAFVSCNSPQTYTDLSLGDHTFAVRAIDSSGNTDPTPATYNWTIILPPDTTAPETVITSQPAGPSSEAVSFGFTGSDEVTPTSLLTYECRLDSGDWVGCTSPSSYTLTPGAHTFEVRAVDEAGNADSTPAAYSWTVEVADTIPPETTIDSGPADGPDTSATFTFSANEPGSVFICDLDGVSLACASPVTYTGLAVGDHIFLVRAIDEAGNVDPTAAVHEWAVEPPPDTTAPETTISSGPGATTTSTDAAFSFTASESGSTFECSLDGAAFTACASPASYSGLAVGGHSFNVRATDPAGNTDATPASYSWTVEATPVSCTPLTLSANADSWIDSGSKSSNKGTDSILKVQAKTGSNLRALVRFDLSSIPPGCTIESATLRLYAASWTNGRTLRALRITSNWTETGVTWSNQPSTTTSSAATTSSGSGYREWNVTSQVQAMYTGSNNGFLIRDANEGGGGSEQQFHSREKGVDMPQLVITFAAPDTTAPETTIDSGPASPTTDSTASFAFSSNETGSTFQCSLDGAAFAACNSQASYTGLALGDHTFAVRATDPAGNTDATPATYAWTIEAPPPDTTAPETTIDSGPANPTTSAQASFTFSSNETGSTFECALDGAAFAACASPAELTGLAVGEHTFAVRATDAAGNLDESAASYSWVVEEAPACVSTTVTVQANADAWINQGSPSENKGSDSILKVMSKSGDNNLRAFVLFSLPQAPDGCVVQSATLRLYAASSSSGRTLQAWQLAGSWTENGVNWDTQPVTTGSAATTTSGSGWREWSVAALVQNMYDLNANYGFMIRDAAEDQDAEQQFHSREKGESIPELVITFGP
jgi:hypothetical protein